MDVVEVENWVDTLRNNIATKEASIEAAQKLKAIIDLVEVNESSSDILSFPAQIFLENRHPEVRVMGLDIAKKSKFYTLLISLAKMLEEEKRQEVQKKIKDVMDSICAKTGHQLRKYSSSEVFCIVNDLNKAQNMLNEKMLRIIGIIPPKNLRKRCLN
jgi:hypothetical protein